MKLTVRLLVMGVAMIALLIPSVNAQKSFCEMAHSDCYAQKQAYFKSCQVLGGSFAYCYNEANDIYEGCMGAWGCVPLNN